MRGYGAGQAAGGQDEPEAWYQTNEITRMVAAGVGGRPVFLHAPALPGGADLHDQLLAEPSIEAVLGLWTTARCALLGVGAPPSTRVSLPGFAAGTAWLSQAVGDICSRFYDADGVPLAFPGSERLIATGLNALRAIPVTVALATGVHKVPSIRAGARAGWFTHLVTDVPTASALLAPAGNTAS